MAKNVVQEIRRATAPEVHLWSGAGHREAPAEPVVPQVRLGVFSLALAVGCVQDYSRS